jgi:magnesium transporter
MDEKTITLVQEQVEDLLKANQTDALQQLLTEFHPADIAELLDELSAQDAVTVFEILPDEVASEVLDETGSEVRQELVDKIDDERLADLLDELPMDDAAEFLEDLPEKVADRLLDLMEPDEAEEVRELLSYEEETAGRLMTRDVAMLRRYWTAAEAIEYLHALNETDEAESLHYLYVVDRYDRLLGVVPIRSLLLARPNVTIETIMQTNVVSILVTADQEELAETVSKYDFVSIPVVDLAGRLLGVVTVDDVLDILEEEATEDIQRLGGSEPLDQPYFAVSVMHMVRKRVIWLLLLFVAATLTGTVIRTFEYELETVIALGIFIPLVTGTGGNAGSQTVTTVIRALALGEVKLDDILRVWKREVLTGLLLGLLLGVVGFIRAITWDTGYRTFWDVSLVVALTLPLVVIWANSVATVVPIIAERLKIDPTVISAPMITTIVDATGLAIYFLIAKWLLGL